MISYFSRTVFVLALFAITTSIGASRVEAQLAAEAQVDEPDVTVRLYYLQFAKAEDAVNLVERLFVGDRRGQGVMQIAIDARTNSIIVSAEEGAHKQIESLLKIIDSDTPAVAVQEPAESVSNVQVEVYWIADVDSADAEQFGDALKELPESISDLVETKLKDRLSLENPQLVSRVYIQSIVQESREGHFEAQRLGESGKNGLLFSTHGVLTKTGDDQYQIDIQLELQVAQEESQVNTLISTKADHPICLALAQTGGLDSVFIVRLTSVDE